MMKRAKIILINQIENRRDLLFILHLEAMGIGSGNLS